MALDLPIPTEVEVEVSTLITASTLRVNVVTFNFDTTKAFAFVSFGEVIGEVFQSEKSEIWVLSGDYYIGVITQQMPAGSLAEVLLGAVAQTVGGIHIDPALKATLLGTGELIVLPGEITKVFPIFDM